MRTSKHELAAVAAASLAAATHGGRVLKFQDGLMTFDAQTIDSAGVFLVGELERLDQRLHDPLASVTWSRDIDLREDVSIADEFSSFTNSSFASPNGVAGSGKSWVGKDANAIAGVSVDIGKTTSPLNLWALQLGWTIPELESAQKLGRPIDQQKLQALQLKWQMDTDEQVYIGDSALGLSGLVNSSLVSVSNVVNGAGGSPLWANKTPAEILADINTLLGNAWTASGYAVCPGKLLVDPVNYSRLVSTLVSSAGNVSLLTYLRDNSLSNSLNGRPLDIQPLKWLTGRGTSGTNRMVAYTQAQDRVRFPMVPLQRTPLEFRDLRQLTTYFGRLGAVEFVYPETLAYADGL